MRVVARAAALLFPLSAAAYAAGPVYNVNSVADVPDAAIDGICETATSNGICTLRAAVMEANQGPNPSGEEVTINLPAGLYLLTIPIGVPDDDRNGDLNLVGKVNIAGAGFDASIIDANGVDRGILIQPGAVVTLSNLRVQNGRPPQGDARYGFGEGGGIYNAGTLTMFRCLLRKNETVAPQKGGGIMTTGTLTFTESTSRVNTAHGSSAGGGIASTGTTTISRSTINANYAAGGGGLFQSGGVLRIVNSTISQNLAGLYGGGLYLHLTSAALNNVTIATNTNSFEGEVGGADLEDSSMILSNVIFDQGAEGELSCHGVTSITSNGHNIVTSPGTCSITGAVLTGSALVGPLDWYGGLTATHPLPSNSPALGAGSPAGCVDPLGTPLTVDQRGVKRPIGAYCDLGAFEVEPIGDASGDGVVNVSDAFYLINYLFAGGPVPLGRANVNGGSTIDVADVFYLLNFLFAGGPAPV